MRKIRLAVLVCVAAYLLLEVLPAAAAEVAQGKCVGVDMAAHRLTIEEYGVEMSKDAPYGTFTGRVLVFDTAEAKIGITPEPGDILRIAYGAENGLKRAIKVMNVSKQDMRKK